DPVPDGSGSTRSFTVTGLVNGVEYPFAVTARSVKGTSGPGTVVKATPHAANLPGAPTNLSVTVGNQFAAITFTPPERTDKWFTVTASPDPGHSVITPNTGNNLNSINPVTAYFVSLTNNV